MSEPLRTSLRRALDDGISVATFGYLIALVGVLLLVHWLAGHDLLTLEP